MEDGRAMTVDVLVVGLPSSKKKDNFAPSEYKFEVSLFTGRVVDVVGMSLNECVYLENSLLEVDVSRLWSFVTLFDSKVTFS